MLNFTPGAQWRMRGGHVAQLYPLEVKGVRYVSAHYLDRMSVFTEDGRYWFHEEESEFDLIEPIES